MRWIRRSDQRILRLASVGFHNGQPERGANRSVNLLEDLAHLVSWRRHSVYGDHEVARMDTGFGCSRFFHNLQQAL